MRSLGCRLTLVSVLVILLPAFVHAQESAQDMHSRISGAAAGRRPTQPGKDVVVAKAVKVDKPLSQLPCTPDPRTNNPWHIGEVGSFSNQSLGIARVTHVDSKQVVVNYCNRQLTLIGVKPDGLVEDDILQPSCAFQVVKIDRYAGEDYYTLQPVVYEVSEKEAAAIRKRTDEAAKAEKAKRDHKAAQEAAEDAAKWRTWSDSNGRALYAKFSGMIAGRVKLVKRDGTTVQVPLEKLSDQDQKWIESRKK